MKGAEESDTQMHTGNWMLVPNGNLAYTPEQGVENGDPRKIVCQAMDVTHQMCLTQRARFDAARDPGA